MKKSVTKIKIDERGQILIIAIIVVALLMTFSSIIVGYTTYEVQAGRQSNNQGQALALAEAGLDKAIYSLNADPNYSGEADTTLGNGTFTVAVSTVDSSTKQITSTGYIPNSSNPRTEKIVRSNVNINAASVSFNFGVQVGAGGLHMTNNTTVNGNVFSDGSITGSGIITSDAIVAGGTASTPDQQSTAQNADFSFGDISARLDAAQSFVPSVSGTMNTASVNIKKNGSPGNLTVKILSDNSGEPSKSVLATGTISSSTVGSNYGFIDAGFTSAPNVTAGQTYWLMLAASSANSSNYYQWGLDTANGYASGTGMYSANWNTGNPSWNSAGGDLGFKTWAGGVITSISGVTVQGNATAHELDSCTVSGDAYYATNNTCTVGGTLHPNTPDTAPQPLPVSDSQIQDWHTVASSGGVISGDYTVSGTQTMGPKEINGNLTITGTLNLTGPIWVKGNLTFDNNAHVNVSPSLGNSGTIILADNPDDPSGSGQVVVQNNTIFSGNGQTNSYVMIVSTNTSNNAMTVSNNSVGAIFYAAAGTVLVSNNVTAYQLTGYSIELSNNATINYQSGLANATFSNGPGGSWQFVPGTYVILK